MTKRQIPCQEIPYDDLERVDCVKLLVEMSESVKKEAKEELGPNTRTIEGRKNVETLRKLGFENQSQTKK